MQPAEFEYPDQERADAFYDPSSADGYSQRAFLENNSGSDSLLTGVAGGPANLGFAPTSLDQARQFRGADVAAASPSSSPHTVPVSPGLHQRTSSFGSEGMSPPSHLTSTELAYDTASLQPLGQLGRITLDDNSRYAPTFDTENTKTVSPGSFYSQDNSPTPVSPPSTYGTGSFANVHPSLVSYSANAPSMLQAQPQHPTPQLSIGIPTVSISDTSMDVSSAATTTDNMPSIQVMAPSPSTPRAGGKQGPNGGFQSLLAHLSAGQPQNAPGTRSAVVTATQVSSSTTWSMEPESYSMPLSLSGGIGGVSSGPGVLLAPSNGPGPGIVSSEPQHDAWTHDALAHKTEPSQLDRSIPSGYSAESSMTFAEMSGGGGKPTYIQGQWSSQAKRQDSYDKIRQFLRLDVDMGFAGSPKLDSPTTSGLRKRASSDVGPRSPIAGLGSDPDWIRALNHMADPPSNNVGEGPHSTALDWQDLGNSDGPGAVPAIATSHHCGPLQTSTMDPSVLGKEPSLVQSNASSPHSTTHSDAGMVSYSNAGFAASIPAAVGVSGEQSNDMGADRQGQSHVDGGQPSPQSFAAWKFPMQGSGDDASAALPDAFPSFLATPPQHHRRSHGSRHGGGGHRRGARSEDLSRLGANRAPTEDFLSSITAPDGGLAPPSSGRSGGGPGPSPPSTSLYTSGGSSARVHPYRSSHNRHHSFSSSTSNSSTGSTLAAPSPEPRIPHSPYQGYGVDDVSHYSSTALPTYTSIATHHRSSSVTSSIGSPGSASFLTTPLVPVVTSQATQAASASRRKGEALFSCPVPGCGSTFTRQYNLRGHLRSHADERPFKCEWPGCQKSFARAHDCKRHQNLHLNIKPHTCEHCGKTFARLDALNRHHKSDTGGCTMKPSDASDEDRDSIAFEGRHVADASMEADPTPGPTRMAFGGHVL
ncbi:hypothetical protein ACQY0O_002227 [Thecaphora frezii]